MTYRSFLPLPCSTRMSIRSRSISVSLSDTTSEARRPVVSQAQQRLVLDVYRRGEQSTDLFRAQNNGQTARLAGRDEPLGKIVALQRDLEEEPQGSGTDVGGRCCRPDRRQPQLIAMDILGGGLFGRPAQKIGKPFDVTDIMELGLGAKPV